MARRRARELAFRTLFQAERGGVPVLEVWHQVREELAEAGELEEVDHYGDPLDRAGIDFADRLVRAYSKNADFVDRRLTEVLEGWTFNQMNQTDLNVLRLAITELIYEPEIPGKVTIEMAVRNAKRFGGEDSGRFVNGVLARLFRDLRTEGRED